MKIRKGLHKTQTAQPRTCAKLNEPEKVKNDNNVEILLSLCNSMDELYNNLSKLSNVLEKKIEEHTISRGKEIINENKN